MCEGIKTAIHERFPTESACASAMGWPRQRLNKITQGKKEPSVSELGQISTATEMSLDVIAQIFLTYWSPNG